MSQSFGVIKANNDVINPGSDDWLVQKTGPGNYVISFAYPRPYVPVVIVGGFNNNTSPVVAANTLFSVYSVDRNAFSVVVMDTAGNRQDADFSFIASW